MDKDQLEALERAHKARSTWQYRAIEATRSHTTIAGMILLAALGKQPTKPPFFLEAAVIDTDGMVYADRYVSSNDSVWGEVPVQHIDVILEFFRRLADKLKLSDDETKELFVALRQWIRIDRRH